MTMEFFIRFGDEIGMLFLGLVGLSEVFGKWLIELPYFGAITQHFSTYALEYLVLGVALIVFNRWMRHKIIFIIAALLLIFMVVTRWISALF